MDYLSQVVNAAKKGNIIPPEPEWNKWLHRNEGKTHCEVCLKLHECWFAKPLTPKWPHHEHCHCILEKIPYVNIMYNASADCPYAKFDPYLFDPENFYKHGKSKMLENWEYSVEDSSWLQNEIQKQGLAKYIQGDYQLGVLNEHGQRISIRIEIPNRTNGKMASFITGWMVHPSGKITLNTPYGGK